MGKQKTVPNNLREGDVVVFGYVNADGNVTSERFHAGIIMETNRTFEGTYYAAHTTDNDYKLLKDAVYL